MISLLGCIIDLIAPRPCAVCGCRLAVDEEAICTVCNLHLPRTHYAARPYDNELTKLFWRIIPIERAASLFFYDAHSEAANLIYALKYGDRPTYGEAMGRMLAEEMLREGFFEDIDIIVPVPLARNRQRERGYNQSTEIARGIAAVTKLPIAGRAVKRDAFRESQTTKDRRQRQANVENVFHLRDADVFRGKHVLLVDDVITTGSTMTSLAEEIMKAGDVRFSIVSLACVKR